MKHGILHLTNEDSRHTENAEILTQHSTDDPSTTDIRFHEQLDDSTNMLILFYLANRWLAIRFDGITLILTGATALMAVLTHGTIPAATAGLAISYANQVA